MFIFSVEDAVAKKHVTEDKVGVVWRGGGGCTSLICSVAFRLVMFGVVNNF